jgi:hypothetical protein
LRFAVESKTPPCSFVHEFAQPPPTTTLTGQAGWKAAIRTIVLPQRFTVAPGNTVSFTTPVGSFGVWNLVRVIFRITPSLTDEDGAREAPTHGAVLELLPPAATLAGPRPGLPRLFTATEPGCPPGEAGGFIGAWLAGASATWTVPAGTMTGVYTATIQYTKAAATPMDGRLRLCVGDSNVDFAQPPPTSSIPGISQNCAGWCTVAPLQVAGRFTIAPGMKVALVATAGAVPGTGIWNVVRVLFSPVE